MLAYFTFNGLQTSTMNWHSFSQVTFAFAVTPDLLVQGIVWAVLIGLIGGLFPPSAAPACPSPPPCASFDGAALLPFLNRGQLGRNGFGIARDGHLDLPLRPGLEHRPITLAIPTFCPPASSRSSSTVTRERAAIGGVHHRADGVKSRCCPAPSPARCRNLKARRRRGIFRSGRGPGSVSLLRRQLLEMLQPHHRHDQPRDQNHRRHDRPDDHLPRHGWFLRRGRQHQLGLLPAARALVMVPTSSAWNSMDPPHSLQTPVKRLVRFIVPRRA